MKVRVSEHHGVSPRIEKPVKGTLLTSARDHMLSCDHHVVWEGFRKLESESSKFMLELKESLFIEKDKPTNRNQFSQELLILYSASLNNLTLRHFH